MLRRSFPLLILALCTATVAHAQSVPTLTLGASATVSLVPPGQIQADGKPISLLLVVTDEGGKLANEVKFRGSATNVGRLDAECPQVGPGLYSCAYTAPETVGSGKLDFKVKAKLPSGTSLAASYALDLTGESKVRVAMNAEPAELVLRQRLGRKEIEHRGAWLFE